MIELCPVPLWFRLTLGYKSEAEVLRNRLAQLALWGYQMKNYGLKLEIPPFDIPEDLKELTYIMQQKPHKLKKVA